MANIDSLIELKYKNIEDQKRIIVDYVEKKYNITEVDKLRQFVELVLGNESKFTREQILTLSLLAVLAADIGTTFDTTKQKGLLDNLDQLCEELNVRTLDVMRIGTKGDEILKLFLKP